MGIVAKQSIKNLITTYLGFGIGALNTLFLYVNFMSETYYGLVGFIVSTAMIVMPFMAFGVPNTIVKFFSSYDSTGQSNFLSWILWLPMFVAIPMAFICYFFYTEIANFLSSENAIVKDYVWHIFIIAVSAAYFEVFYAWSKVHLKSVFGNFMKEVFHRLAIMVLLILLAIDTITVTFFINSLVGVYVVRMVVMKGYAYHLKMPSISLTRKRPNNSKDVLKYTTLIIIAGSVATLLLDLDKFMLGLYQEIDTIAYYGVAIYIATVISVPLRAMHQITYPMVASMLNENRREEMAELYQKSSISLLVVSGLLFVLISCNIESLYELLNPNYAVGLYVVLLIGTAKLFDNMLGINNAIVFNSDYYRLVLFIGVFLVGIAILLNILLIPSYGIYGAAIATFIASLLYGVLKILIVKNKFGMQPFTMNTILIVGVILVFVLSFYFWNFKTHPLLSILLKSIVISLLYLLVIYKLNISPDINTAIHTLIKRRNPK
jgi:O-antigen/teichoic acid export membrane protein